MASEQTSTPPPATRAQASTTARDTSGESTPAPLEQQMTMTPPASDVGLDSVQSSLETQLKETKNVENFKPYQ
jgi:hypothetical protein